MSISGECKLLSEAPECNCYHGFTGIACQSCTENFVGDNCERCQDEYIGYNTTCDIFCAHGYATEEGNILAHYLCLEFFLTK